MKLNNKGMAISGILYSILVLFIVLVFGILSLLASSKYSFDKFKADILEKLNGDIDPGNKFKELYVEEILNGAIPDLDSQLIPVEISNVGIVTKADIYKDWYSYAEKRWANAVLVKETGTRTREQYLSDPSGVTINPDDILAYYVWIPRFKYKIVNNDGTKSEELFEIVFENLSEIESTGSLNGTFKSHPAFKISSTKVNGMWFGKFMTTGSTSEITIKPNLPIFTNNSLASTWNFAKTLNNGNFTSVIIRNDDWGAVNYLSYSKYGIGSQIFPNSHTNKTGCGSGTLNDNISDICSNYYGGGNTPTQSSTGNMTGVFDLASNRWQYTMTVLGNYNDAALVGANSTSTSGFIGPLANGSNITTGVPLPDHRYRSLIYFDSPNLFVKNSMYIGYATVEVKNWFGYLYTEPLASTGFQWVKRGGYSTTNASTLNQFGIKGGTGVATNSDGFRFALKY